ncbi:MAG: Gfo/Idh/MocA family oxidoreductase [Deltaproteobacteria bacterium]|jgi:predicted dehydrogenase|nr:Gfo/Idh/MocA family oxidoreductase [Deltaproteobacteria bacterium]
MEKLRVGLIGCGVISDIYLKTCQKFEVIDIVACASLDLEESRQKAKQYNIAKVCQPDELIQDPDIDCILNLTIPAVHAEISMAALEAGKHVYSEKPFATDLKDGEKILALAKSKNLFVGNAPDTFLGGRLQTCRKIIDDGIIGEPTGASAFVGTHGVERHHPNPAFYYQTGAGPLLDLGPYYLTALISMLGPIKRSCGFSKKTFSERIIESQPRHGEMMQVEVDTHICGTLEFENGVIGSLMTSFDIWDSQLPRLEIYGKEGTICMPDPDPVDGPNIFGGEVYYKTRETARWSYKPRVQGLEEWTVAENNHGYNEDSRGLGLADMAYAIKNQRPHRANGEMAHHVLETMLGLLESSQKGAYSVLKSTCSIPAALPADFPLNEA